MNEVSIKSFTHWGRVTHLCVGKLTIIGSDNGLSPVRRQAIIWTNAGILLIGPLGTKFNQIVIAIHTFSFTKMHLKLSSAKWRPFCLGLNMLTLVYTLLHLYLPIFFFFFFFNHFDEVLPLVAPEVVILTTSDAASDETCDDITKCIFHCVTKVWFGGDIC